MYLQTIFRLTDTRGEARTKVIADTLGITMGSVTNTIRGLQRLGLVKRRAYHGVTLTPEGRRIAVKMLRRHRLAERFLTEKLGMEWSEVHDIACRLEHSFTDDMIEPLEKLLENPTTCPHGNPVAANLSGRGDERPLPEWPPARKGIVSRVTEEKTDLLRYLASLGLTPGTEIRVDERAPFNGPILVRVRGSRYALGREVAERIRVKSV
jgi:DtxR family Mn-dependent transcriptional regulator